MQISFTALGNREEEQSLVECGLTLSLRQEQRREGRVVDKSQCSYHHAKTSPREKGRINFTLRFLIVLETSQIWLLIKPSEYNKMRTVIYLSIYT